ncbi:unnamed protein product, partial [Sphacelaria rigidula]
LNQPAHRFRTLSNNYYYSNTKASASRSSSIGVLQLKQATDSVSCSLSTTPVIRGGTLFRNLQKTAASLVFFYHHISATFLTDGQLVPMFRIQCKFLLRPQEHTFTTPLDLFFGNLTKSGSQITWI